MSGGGGQQLGRRQAHLVTYSGVTSEGVEGFGGGARVVRGELLGRTHAFFITVVVHCLLAFCTGAFNWQIPLTGVYSTSLRTF